MAKKADRGEERDIYRQYLHTAYLMGLCFFQTKHLSGFYSSSDAHHGSQEIQGEAKLERPREAETKRSPFQELQPVTFLPLYAQYFDNSDAIKLGGAPGSSWYHHISAATTTRHSFVNREEWVLSGQITSTGEKL